MSNWSLVLVAVISALSYGCATYRPIVDTKGVDMVAYENDMRECQAYAEQESPGSKAAAGAVGGAVIGVAISALFGTSRNRGAAVVAASGAGAGAGAGMRAQVAITRNCMAGRGYKVLY